MILPPPLKGIQGSRVAVQDPFLSSPGGFDSMQVGVDTRIPRAPIWARALPKLVRGKILMIYYPWKILLLLLERCGSNP